MIKLLVGVKSKPFSLTLDVVVSTGHLRFFVKKRLFSLTEIPSIKFE